jgi:hypothetical protein
MSALLRDAIVAIPFAADHHPAARAAAEAQAPAAACVAVFFVLPEGFVLRDAAWRMTAHRRQRDRAVARLAVHRRATRAGPGADGEAMGRSFEPALPAVVRCPECGRHNEVTEAAIEAMLDEIAADFNRRAGVLPQDAAGFLRYVGEGLGYPLVGVPEDRVAHIWLEASPASLNLTDHPGTDRWGGAVFFLERLRMLCPTLPLVIALAQGKPVRREDFFVVALPREFPVALADRPHYVATVERVSDTDLLRGLIQPVISAPPGR